MSHGVSSTLAWRPSAAGRHALLMIVPERDTYAARPDCLLCTWVWTPRGFRLKYLSRACSVHQLTPRVPA